MPPPFPQQTVNFLNHFLKTRYHLVNNGLVVTNKEHTIKFVVNMIHDKESDVVTHHVRMFKKHGMYLSKSAHHYINSADHQVYVSDFIGEMIKSL